MTGFFYGSNIHPYEEYTKRLAALQALTAHDEIEVDLGDYRPDQWFAGVAGLLDEPEGGRRCLACFLLQLEAAAQAAVARGCSHLTTTLTISPHKNVSLISRVGNEVALQYGLTWEDRIWRKNDGFLRSLRISKELGLYRQNYCGCQPSLEQNLRREQSVGRKIAAGDS